MKWNSNQDSGVSRNRPNSNLVHLSNCKERQKTNVTHDASAIRLENSQEIRNYFGTLAPSHARRRESKQENLVISRNDGESNSAIRSKKGIIKTRKYINERAQNVASVYKSSLNIANFLSNYTTNAKSMKLVKKRRKSGRSITNGAVAKASTSKIKIRSRSNHPLQVSKPQDRTENNGGSVGFAYYISIYFDASKVLILKSL